MYDLLEIIMMVIIILSIIAVLIKFLQVYKGGLIWVH